MTKMAAMTIYGKNLKKSSCQKPLIRFSKNFTGMTFEGSPEKVVQRNLIRQKTWPQELVELCMCRSVRPPGGCQTITQERLCLGSWNFIGTLIMTRRWPLLILRSLGQRSRSQVKVTVTGNRQDLAWFKQGKQPTVYACSFCYSSCLPCNLFKFYQM